VPRRLAALIRPELPSLQREIREGIRRAIPEYGPGHDGRYERALQLGAEQAVQTFVNRVASPDADSRRNDEVFRMLGQFEALEGRSLDNLQAAIRIGARIAWRRATEVGQRLHLHSSVMSSIADSLFGYVEELAQLAQEGYQAAAGEARLRRQPNLAERRARLLDLIMREPSPGRRRIAEQAKLAAWPMPEQVTLVALAGTGTGQISPTAFDDDLLVDTAGERPYVLVPGAVDEERQAVLAAALATARRGDGSGTVTGAIGLPVAPEQARDSLRWARRLLDLWSASAGPSRPGSTLGSGLAEPAFPTGPSGPEGPEAEGGRVLPLGPWLESGGPEAYAARVAAEHAKTADSTVPATQESTREPAQASTRASTQAGAQEPPLIRCEDHLLALWLHSDPHLVDEIARRALRPVAEMPAPQAGRLVDTMYATCVSHDRSATAVAELLDLHPQSVRYRLKTLHSLFGRVTTPEQRERAFAVEAVLRALYQRQRRDYLQRSPL